MEPLVRTGPVAAGRTALSMRLEHELETWLSGHTPADQAPTLRALLRPALLIPAQEFLDRPGKAFRGRLVARAWTIAGGAPGETPMELELIVELLHAGSLIIDDIQDDWTERRGAPALHHLYGTPTAINTANFLYCWPLEMLGRLGLPDPVTLELYRRVSSTLLRCHQGQALNLTVRVCDLPQERVPDVVGSSAILKAGALMELAASLGAMAAGGASRRSAALARFGRELGVALQRLDDLSGITSESRRHKGREDFRLSRLSWVWSWLAQTTDTATYERCRRQGARVVDGDDPDRLAAVLRPHLDGARREVCQDVLAALTRLRVVVGGGRHIDALSAELDLLERSYV